MTCPRCNDHVVAKSNAIVIGLCLGCGQYLQRRKYLQPPSFAGEALERIVGGLKYWWWRGGWRVW